ncbi:MAG: c-type cytochrome biogenesis protein CcsB [Deltaproteobacteria bacterium]|nr:c-type cytochrome biogenesis protein CcsB [Deltaproteobacteria bacterium]MBW2306864.1 c-type cytochrome biogenesis protein CcsB [Deltaproteobacteria bacterium]
MHLIFFQFTFVLYLLGVGLATTYIFLPRDAVGKAGVWVLGAGFVVHTVTLVTRTQAAGHTPVVNLHESLSFFAWAVMAAYMVFHRRYHAPILGAFVSPLVLILILYASACPQEIVPLQPALKSFWLPIHTGVAFLANGFLSIAFCVGIMYLIQENRIKKKKIGKLHKLLPSLDVLDDISYRSLKIGFPLLTIGIITGAVWASSAWGSYWSWDPKETWSLITWLLYAALLHQRLTVGWRGRRAAIMTVAGFIAIIFTFLGVNLLLIGLHGYT